MFSAFLEKFDKYNNFMRNYTMYYG